MAKKLHPHYSWLLHYNEYKPGGRDSHIFPKIIYQVIKTGEQIRDFPKLKWSMGNPQRSVTKKLTKKISNKISGIFLLNRRIHIFASLIHN